MLREGKQEEETRDVRRLLAVSFVIGHRQCMDFQMLNDSCQQLQPDRSSLATSEEPYSTYPCAKSDSDKTWLETTIDIENCF